MRRPLVLAVLLVTVAGAAVIAIAGLARLAHVIEARPVTIAAEAEALSAALEAAPWIDAGGEGPILWLVAQPSEPSRGVSLAEEAARLRQAGFAVRVIVAAARTDANAARLFQVAEAARLRDVRALDWRAAPGGAHGLDAEREGALEWARASYERIAASLAANERTLQTPAYVWRANGAWRVALGANASARAHVRREHGLNP